MSNRPLIYRIIEAFEGDERLSTTDRLVLVLLTKYANRDGDGCTVSNDRLACGAAVAAVQRESTRARPTGSEGAPEGDTRLCELCVRLDDFGG